MDAQLPECPPQVVDFAGQAVDYVKRAVGLDLDFDHRTLPFLDHYLREAADGAAGRPAATLVAATAGAYFGEVVRRHLGGDWELAADPAAWRLVLPSGLSICPAGLVAAALLRAEPDELDARLDAPLGLRPHLDAAVGRMAALSEDEYYSLGGRFDTVEHLDEVLRAVVAQRD